MYKTSIFSLGSISIASNVTVHLHCYLNKVPQYSNCPKQKDQLSIVIGPKKSNIFFIFPRLKLKMSKSNIICLLVNESIIDLYRRRPVMSITQWQPRKDPLVQPCITALDNW